MQYFWTNTIWFILLGISTIIELIVIFIFANAKNRKTVIALYFTLSGMTFGFELQIFALLKSYNYYPMLIPNSPFDDGIIGNLFSQYSVSATALMIAVLNLKYYWFFIFAGVYGIIEELFLYLGIYKHNWYQTWMTIVGLILLFWIAKRMYKSSLKYIGRIWRYIYIFFGLFALHVNTMWGSRVLGIHTFSENFLPNIGTSLGLLSGLYMFLLSNIIMIIYFLKLKFRWKAIVILVLYIAHYVAFKLNLMFYKEGWFLIFTTIAIFSMYLYVYILDKLYGQTKKGENNIPTNK